MNKQKIIIKKRKHLGSQAYFFLCNAVIQINIYIKDGRLLLVTKKKATNNYHFIETPHLLVKCIAAKGTNFICSLKRLMHAQKTIISIYQMKIISLVKTNHCDIGKSAPECPDAQKMSIKIKRNSQRDFLSHSKSTPDTMDLEGPDKLL